MAMFTFLTVFTVESDNANTHIWQCSYVLQCSQLKLTMIILMDGDTHMSYIVMFTVNMTLITLMTMFTFLTLFTQ